MGTQVWVYYPGTPEEMYYSILFEHALGCAMPENYYRKRMSLPIKRRKGDAGWHIWYLGNWNEPSDSYGAHVYYGTWHWNRTITGSYDYVYYRILIWIEMMNRRKKRNKGV